MSLDYAFSEDIMGYLSWSRGFRSGGFNGRATTPSSIGPYDPETVDSYEVGLRSSLLDNRLIFNATLFRAKYKDKHESEIYQFGAATETVVNNAAEATIDGLEVEAMLAAGERVQLRLSVGMIDGKYEEFLAPDRIACQGISRATCPKVDRSDDFEFGFQPDWNVSAGLIVTQPLANGWGPISRFHKLRMGLAKPPAISANQTRWGLDATSSPLVANGTSRSFGSALRLRWPATSRTPFTATTTSQHLLTLACFGSVPCRRAAPGALK